MTTKQKGPLAKIRDELEGAAEAAQREGLSPPRATKLGAAGHVKLLQEHVKGIGVAEERERAAKGVLDEWKAKAKEAFATMRELVAHPQEQLEEHELDHDTGEPTDLVAYMRKIREREAEIERANAAESLADAEHKRAKAHAKKLLEHLRALVQDPSAELPFEGEEDEDDDQVDGPEGVA